MKGTIKGFFSPSAAGESEPIINQTLAACLRVQWDPADGEREVAAPSQGLMRSEVNEKLQFGSRSQICAAGGENSCKRAR